MDMPKYGCDHCFLRTGNYCGRIEKDESVVEYARKNERHPDCPLLLIPPHGRLISAFDTVKTLCDKGLYMHAEIVSEMPTIIPAEEGE
jgi:hypothetical protein